LPLAFPVNTYFPRRSKDATMFKSDYKEHNWVKWKLFLKMMLTSSSKGTRVWPPSVSMRTARCFMGHTRNFWLKWKDGGFPIIPVTRDGGKSSFQEI
jgi:hypothetical protein